jgi:hypothetical protein
MPSGGTLPPQGPVPVQEQPKKPKRFGWPAHRNTRSYGFFDGENTLLTGSAKQLDDLIEDDVFRASVTVLGKMDYDTQIGGNTTVPLLEVNSLKVIG